MVQQTVAKGVVIFTCLVLAGLGYVYALEERHEIKELEGIRYYIADTDEKRISGLSNFKPLKDHEAMLFVFEEPAKYNFWMKDMNFSIDIIWLNEKREIITVYEGVTPDTYPQIFSPDKSALYVIEGNAGFFKRQGWVKGGAVSLPL